MSKAKITITGEIQKKWKEKEDGTIDLLLKADTSQAVPKGLKYLGESIYNIHIGKKTWKKVSSVITEESKLLIQGEPKACVNSKGIPYVAVNCMDISIIEPKIKENKDEKPKEEKTVEVKKELPKVESVKQEPVTKKVTPEKGQVKKPNKKSVIDLNKSVVENWYKSNEIVKVNVADIVLTNKSHLRGCNLQVTNLDKVTSDRQKVTVRGIEDGKYALVLGFKAYIISKVLGFETINAVVTELTHDELIKELGIENN